jgi:hypothetical protein
MFMTCFRHSIRRTTSWSTTSYIIIAISLITLTYLIIIDVLITVFFLFHFKSAISTRENEDVNKISKNIIFKISKYNKKYFYLLFGKKYINSLNIFK